MTDPFHFFAKLKTDPTVNAEAEIRLKAARTLVKVFDDLYEGAFAVDVNCRIIWMNHKFKALIGWNGVEALEGQNLQDVLPHTNMRTVIEEGRPDLIDIIDLGERQITISRIPLTNEQDQIVGAMGVILFDRLNALKPLVSRFQRMQQDLQKAEQELARTRKAKYRFHDYVGQDKSVLTLKRQARRAADRNVPILLLGETGTGKELIAHAIHASSPRISSPMIRLNIAAIPEGLLEAELFGAAAGSYTGSGRKDRPGKFQLADQGTLFLDEIGDMPLALQSKLLRVLQEGEVEAIGSHKIDIVDVRIISATSRNLAQMVEDGSFRADLFYRLNVMPLHIPPLRNRLSDLPLLCDAILFDIAENHGIAPPALTDKAIAYLQQYHWPGNVRELKNILEQACTHYDEDHLDISHIQPLLPVLSENSPILPEILNNKAKNISDNVSDFSVAEMSLKEIVAETEKKAILQALKLENQVKSRAAKRLGISRAQLYEKITNYNL